MSHGAFEPPWESWLRPEDGVTHIDLDHWGFDRKWLQQQITYRARKWNVKLRTDRCPNHYHDCLRVRIGVDPRGRHGRGQMVPPPDVKVRWWQVDSSFEGQVPSSDPGGQ